MTPPRGEPPPGRSTTTRYPEVDVRTGATVAVLREPRRSGGVHLDRNRLVGKGGGVAQPPAAVVAQLP